MNPEFRKAALIAASLGLLLSLFVALRDGGDGGRDAAATAATTTAPASEVATQAQTARTTTQPPPPATTSAPDERVRVAIRIVGGRPQGGIARPTVERGREVLLVVTSDVADHVHVHGYDLFVDVKPGLPAELAFTATTPGRFEIELEDRRVLIADLEVRP